MSGSDSPFLKTVKPFVKKQIDDILNMPTTFAPKDVMKRTRRIYKVSQPETFFYGYTIGYLGGIADGISLQTRGRNMDDNETLEVKEYIETFVNQIREKLSKTLN